MADILQIDIFKYIFLNEMMTEVNGSIMIINAYAADIPSLPTGVSHAPPQLYQGYPQQYTSYASRTQTHLHYGLHFLPIFQQPVEKYPASERHILPIKEISYQCMVQHSRLVADLKDRHLLNLYQWQHDADHLFC